MRITFYEQKVVFYFYMKKKAVHTQDDEISKDSSHRPAEMNKKITDYPGVILIGILVCAHG